MGLTEGMRHSLNLLSSSLEASITEGGGVSLLGIVSEELTKTAAKNEAERLKIAEELVSTEKTYVKGLKAVSHGFVKRLQVRNDVESLKTYLTPKEITRVFLNILDIYDLNHRLYRDLKKIMHAGRLLTSDLPKLLHSYTPFFRLYQSFVTEYEKAMKFMAEMKVTRPFFTSFMELNEAVEGKKISDLMIQPVQRIPRYLLLLKGIVKLTGPDDPTLPDLRRALQQMESMAKQINHSFEEVEARSRVLEVQKCLEDDLILVTTSRLHIKDGPLRKRFNHTTLKMKTDKKYWFFLFNDMLLYTSVPKKDGKCKLKYLLSLHQLSVHDIADQSQDKLTNIIEIKHTIKSFFVVADSAEEKATWLEAFREALKQLVARQDSFKTFKSPCLDIKLEED